MANTHAALNLGTDNGPICDVCRIGTIWSYRLWPGVVSYARAQCCGCHAETTIEWPTRAQAPQTIADMRALHMAERARGFATAVPIMDSIALQESAYADVDDTDRVYEPRQVMEAEADDDETTQY